MDSRNLALLDQILQSKKSVIDVELAQKSKKEEPAFLQTNTAKPSALQKTKKILKPTGTSKPKISKSCVRKLGSNIIRYQMG